MSSNSSTSALDSESGDSHDKDNCYNYPAWRKYSVVAVLSWMTVCSTLSSTSLFSAADEIAAEFSSTIVTINASTAGLLVAMGFSSFIWGPIAIIVGRKIAYNACIIVLLLFTIGTALAPDIRTFTALRVLSGLQGTYFHVAGQTIIAEYFLPVQRGTATGFFLAGAVIGPPLGPLLAGIVVTYQNWRVILWLQTAIVGLGLILSILVIRFPSNEVKEKKGLSHALNHFNPTHVFKQMLYPNVLFTDLTCGLLSWSQYSLLAAPRYIISTRFGLTSPLYSGLFYIAPAAGFLVGTLLGGRYSDMTVKKWIIKRDGTRLPQDRLNSGMWSFFLVVPAASMIYGWGLTGTDDSIQYLALPIIAAFFIAAGLLAAFASINTYCAEVFPNKRREVIAGKYCTQYSFSAIATATAIPLLHSIGVGPTCTISAVLVLIGGALTLITAQKGKELQAWKEKKSNSRRSQKSFHEKWPSSVVPAP